MSLDRQKSFEISSDGCVAICVDQAKDKLRTLLSRWISPAARRIVADLFVSVAPNSVMRISERIIDLPIRNVVRQAPSLFIHIPRNAGTTISQALYSMHVGHRTAIWYRNADRAWFESRFKFAIVRDPVERFLSAFQFLQTGGTAEVPAAQKATRVIQQYASILDFIDAVESGRQKEFLRLDPVFHRQCDYVTDRQGRLIVNRLFQLKMISGAKLAIPGAAIDMEILSNSSAPSINLYDDADRVARFVQLHYDADFRLLAHASSRPSQSSDEAAVEVPGS